MRLLAGRFTKEKTCAVNILNPVLWPVRSKPPWGFVKTWGFGRGFPASDAEFDLLFFGGPLYASR